jgi:uncharacterized glyoxalase superfamily protein PhnB
MPDLTPAPQVWPTLRARDALGLIRFLVDAFGFEEAAVYADAGFVHHAELAWPAGGGIMVGSARATDSADAVSASSPGTFGAYAVTDEPDALYERATRHGARVIHELTDTDYGSREFSVADPEGNRWSFGTYRGQPRKR